MENCFWLSLFMCLASAASQKTITCYKCMTEAECKSEGTPENYTSPAPIPGNPPDDTPELVCLKVSKDGVLQWKRNGFPNDFVATGFTKDCYIVENRAGTKKVRYVHCVCTTDLCNAGTDGDTIDDPKAIPGETGGTDVPSGGTLSCYQCDSEDECKDGGTKKECPLPPPAQVIPGQENFKATCQKVSEEGKVVRKGCYELIEPEFKEDCYIKQHFVGTNKATSVQCICTKDLCNGGSATTGAGGNGGTGGGGSNGGSGGSGGMNLKPTPWNNPMWIGLAYLFIKTLH